MLETLRNAWRIQELRKRILFTLAMFVVFSLGTTIPLPGIDRAAVKQFFGEGSVFGLLNMFSGGAMSDVSIFAMGIMPYINASIIMQLLQVVIPKLKEWAEEGPEGRKKLAQLTRYGTIVLAFLQATGMTFVFFRGSIRDPNFFTYTVLIIGMTAGTAFLMWMGELITEHGIGNGISLLIFAGIAKEFLPNISRMMTTAITGSVGYLLVFILIIMLVLLVIGIIALEEGKRRVPVQYSKRVVGRKVYGGQSTHIPMRINQAGVIPVIFAMAILFLPGTFAEFFPNVKFLASVAEALNLGTDLGLIIYIVFIVLFTYFYTAIQFDPLQVSNDIKKYGGFIPGLRPGRPTAEYLSRISSRLTFVGATSLAAICAIPLITQRVTTVRMIFSGTALIILVGVALDTMKQVESHLMMHNYRGFLK